MKKDLNTMIAKELDKLIESRQTLPLLIKHNYHIIKVRSQKENAPYSLSSY